MIDSLSDFIASQKKRINPCYANTIGTESYERARFVAEVERLERALGVAIPAIRMCLSELVMHTNSEGSDARHIIRKAEDALEQIEKMMAATLPGASIVEVE